MVVVVVVVVVVVLVVVAVVVLVLLVVVVVLVVGGGGGGGGGGSGGSGGGVQSDAWIEESHELLSKLENHTNTPVIPTFSVAALLSLTPQRHNETATNHTAPHGTHSNRTALRVRKISAVRVLWNIRKELPMLRPCVHEAEVTCLRFPHRTAKIIRVTMEEIRALLERNSACVNRFKIIHVLRDPRGKLSSQIRSPAEKRKAKEASYLWTQAQMVCARILRDIRERKLLELEYSGTFLEAHYDDMVRDYAGYAEAAYRHVFGQHPPPEVYAFARTVEDGFDVTKRDDYGVARANATETAFAWRRTLTPTQVQMIEGSTCRELISYLHLDLLYPNVTWTPTKEFLRMLQETEERRANLTRRRGRAHHTPFLSGQLGKFGDDQLMTVSR